MIAIVLSGGLGNQLFQYAFIYNQHKRLNTPFFLVKNGLPIDLYRYFELEMNFFYGLDRVFFNHRGFKLLFSHHLRRGFYNRVCNLLTPRHLMVSMSEDPADVLNKAQNGTLYFGFFQSESYFKDYAAGLLNRFSIKRKYLKAYSEKFSWLKKHTSVVVIHIRMTDYKAAGENEESLILPLSYYHQIIGEIHTPANFYVIMSDDTAAVRKEFDYLEAKYFSGESEIIDFQLMMNADICVIANSTFSWWAAYLNKKKNKSVYCPKHFLGFNKGEDYPAKIYPANWVTVPVL
ncbi:alpha-1,2-fucosyltransferase [Mucilaginibacter xinganensis]|uniref:Glycosyl transferase family 11 n=1 Tax=Mucilaginibacter xinganensis TaxID=1234841 RepID=A0A223P404_9SPHI|nr:alpha-1,2-fucosyltransferase [Mucilaginibacter xinganensis]ASU36816.1 hypothetical protein MuYL_4933 [Mucilaginibacter xinganensis]